ncbi:hypothetical protein C2845_PM06G22940 [Panicum miliaceum]|uniref:Endonuclease/exonuclease/phosphatase domain-containing protein n=1 Tax=Panicum miliaceum TaxID=4540 RepID=A0A3L6RAF0_PANMI|nr:hypothetical protein C2845_PM06G22940 [Panicum miliaceum]
MSTQAHPRFAPLPTEQSESQTDAGAAGYQFRLVSYNILAQELDEYDTFYKKNMENSGYSSIYIQRSGDKRDGCGIFYKPKSAELVQKEGIHYNDLVENYVHSDHVHSAPPNNSSPEEVIIAGDFNSTPGDKVYNYLVPANIESTDEAPIKLRSLYAANGGEPEFTNYTPGFTGTLDYIFLSNEQDSHLVGVEFHVPEA